MEELYAIIVGFLFFFIILAVAAYVLNGLIYTRLGKKAGVKNWGWAWVPYGSWYVGAKVGKLPDYIWITPIALSLGVELVGDLALLVWIGILAYTIYNDKKIMDRFGNNGNLAFLHLIPLIGSIIVLVMIATLAFGDKKPLLEVHVEPVVAS